jgi:uncharacterized protein (DUF58 family)
MNRKSIIHLVVLSFFLLAALATFAPTAAPAAPSPEQTVSGKITAVGDDSFTLEVKAGEAKNFVINAATQVEGELKVGANATVTYRAEEGKNIALRVTVA